MKYYILLALQLFFIGHISATVQPSLAQAKDFASKVSWAFEENKGQVTGKDSAQVRYFYKQGNLTMFLMNGRLAYQFNKTIYPEGYQRQMKIDIIHHPEEKMLQDSLSKSIYQETYRMDLELLGANQNCEIITEGKSPDYIQYYNHNALDVHAYQKITYKNIYPNIDWVIYTNTNRQTNSLSSGEGRGEVKYDFIVHPGGDPSRIKFKTHWVEDLSLLPDGSLVMKNRMGTVTEQKPISFQNGIPLSTEFKLENEMIHFQLPKYDTSKSLVIDPSLAWSSYYGGTGDDDGYGCATDQDGNIFFSGSTASNTVIAKGGHDTVYSWNYMCFLAKFNANGSRIWSTYYGGNGGSIYGFCATDKLGNSYLYGNTHSTINIAYNGFKNSRSPGINWADFFLVKFNSLGKRIWGTYYGDTGRQTATSIITDHKFNVYIAGSTNARIGISFNGHQNTYGGGFQDNIVVKFDSSGARLWGTYYGGDSTESTGAKIAVDCDNNLYLSSGTLSYNNISHNGFQNVLRGGGDGYIVKFTESGTRLWATYFGGTGGDGFSTMSIDHSNNLYLGGSTNSSDFIFHNGFQSTKKGTYEMMVAKFNSNGIRLWSSYFGGNTDDERLEGSTIDNFGNFYITGFTESTQDIFYKGFKSTLSSPNKSDVFVTMINRNGKKMWSSYYGGNNDEFRASAASYKGGYVYLCGITMSSNGIPSGNVFQNNFGGPNGGRDAFIAKILDTFKVSISIQPNGPVCTNQFLTIKLDEGFGGGNYQTKWYKNGVPFSISVDSVSITNFSDKDTIQCLVEALGCKMYDSVWSNKIIISALKVDTLHIYDTMCEPQSYFFNNQNLTTSGTYRDTFTSSQGCDSFLFLHLLVKDTSLHEFTYVTPCDTVSYMFDGIRRTQPGRYTALDTNVQGCDSTIILNLFFRKPTHTRLSPIQICPNSYYVFDGIPRNTTGNYIRYYTNTDGCPSTDSLRISILSSPARQTNPISACAPFTFRGKTYTSSTSVIDTIKSIVGNCDSVIVNNLIQLKPPAISSPEINHIICDSIRLNNRLYTSSFSFIDTFRTVGTVCDSVYRKTNYIIRYTPQIGLKERDTFMRGSLVTLRPFSATNYLWSTGQTTKDVSFKLTEDRQLYIIAWNEEPCRDTAYISLVAEDLAIVGMPTGFSPTGEHVENRTLRPNINGRLEYFHMMVFNRWGEKVYETFDTQPQGWNGIFKGELAPSGLYGYVMEYRTLGLIYNKTGEVMLVR